MNKKTLADALAACAGHLADHAGLLRSNGLGEAADCAGAIALLTQAALKEATFNDRDRASVLLAVASLHAQPNGTGFGEGVIWPAYRRAGMHRPCEEWTSLTNELRLARRLLLQADATQADADDRIVEKETESLATQFSRILREQLSMGEMQTVIERNAARTPDEMGICHSHDFCDANVAMEEASKLCGLSSPVADTSETERDAALQLWNDAWKLAQDSGFTYGLTGVIAPSVVVDTITRITPGADAGCAMYVEDGHMGRNYVLWHTPVCAANTERLLTEATPPERLQAHWKGFVANAMGTVREQQQEAQEVTGPVALAWVYGDGGWAPNPSYAGSPQIYPETFLKEPGFLFEAKPYLASEADGSLQYPKDLAAGYVLPGQTYFQLQKNDLGTLDSDDDAIRHCIADALAGDQYAIATLTLCQTDGAVRVIQAGTLDYVIEIYTGTDQPSYLTLSDDEDGSGVLPRTLDPEGVLRFDTKGDALHALHDVVNAFPSHSFRLGAIVKLREPDASPPARRPMSPGM